MTILVTGFEPFGNDDLNPSYEIVKRLPKQIHNHKIVKMLLPVDFKNVLPKIEAALKEYDPEVLLSLGLAGGREGITVERIGINIDDARIPDNNGDQPQDIKIKEDGPDAYFTNIPIRPIVDGLNAHGFKASISNSAGTYVCNHVIYGTRYLIEKSYPGKQSGFIHVPYLPVQAKGKPSMELDAMVEAITLAICIIIETNEKRQNKEPR